MKKWILLLILGMLGAAGKAQPVNGLAPDFHFRDLNGNWHNLYSYLDQGKTVFIEVSAAWCIPCWNFHGQQIMHTLYQEHGPAGMPGVNTNTTDDVMVFFIEGEPGNTTNQLYGIQGTGSAQFTMGNWVAGTPFPIIDTNAATTNAFLDAWGVTSFPTLFMICRDRQVIKYSQLSAAMYYNAALYNCPSYPPSATADAKYVPYRDKEYFFCNPSPKLRFQNYSTQPLQSADLKIYRNNTLVHTHPWTGSLQPYGIMEVQVPPFSANDYSGYRFEVEAPGDSYPANNKSTDSIFWVYSPANASPLPVFYDFDASPLPPYKMKSNSFYAALFKQENGSPGVVIGVNGQPTRAIRQQFYRMSYSTVTEYIVGNYDLQNAPAVSMEFDLAYAQYNGTENDTLSVEISTDCGATWHTVWLKHGSNMQTTPPVGNFTEFIPSASSHWRHESINLTPYISPNTLIRILGYGDRGNNAYIDNIKIDATLDIPDVPEKHDRASIFPNPASAHINVEFKNLRSSEILIRMTDMTGKTVYEQTVPAVEAALYTHRIPVNALSSGRYYLMIDNGQIKTWQPVTVLH